MSSESGIHSIQKWGSLVGRGGRERPPLLTWLHDPWFCSQVCQIHVGLPAINDGVGVLASPFRSSSVGHGDLSNIHTQTYIQSSKSALERNQNSTGKVIYDKTKGEGRVLKLFSFLFFLLPPTLSWNLLFDPPSEKKRKNQ